ncbi:hypothetical protein CW304_11915 [Bacillus sp. UFRGS-B20]|nr:hypothetical protein CW304_11915 [Bacillus sp. UFRGS-B20]
MHKKIKINLVALFKNGNRASAVLSDQIAIYNVSYVFSILKKRTEFLLCYVFLFSIPYITLSNFCGIVNTFL